MSLSHVDLLMIKKGWTLLNCLSFIRFEDFHNLEEFCPGGMPLTNRFVCDSGREAERGTCTKIVLSCKSPNQSGTI